MRHEIRAAQNVSRMCLVCGIENGAGLRGRFFVLENGELAGMFRPREEHQSYPGRLHGGVISAILDETIGRAINVADSHTWGVTVEFTVRFRRPVPLDREVKAVGRITRDSNRIFEGTGEILLEDGTIAAEAHGRYMKLPIEDIAAVEFSESEWFADRLPLPAQIELGGDL
ncbi:MAG: PaaI family thioesterase [Actinomycetia bacterium]|nr:PaaI family thioesterase [Actinomycetes bacterium]